MPTSFNAQFSTRFVVYDVGWNIYHAMQTGTSLTLGTVVWQFDDGHFIAWEQFDCQAANAHKFLPQDNVLLVRELAFEKERVKFIANSFQVSCVFFQALAITQENFDAILAQLDKVSTFFRVHQMSNAAVQVSVHDIRYVFGAWYSEGALIVILAFGRMAVPVYDSTRHLNSIVFALV